MNIIVEFDFSNVVGWCNLRMEGLWELNFVFNKIMSIMRSILLIKVVFKGREINGVVDSLVK